MIINLILTAVTIGLIIVLTCGIMSAMAISKEWKAQDEFRAWKAKGKKK